MNKPDLIEKQNRLAELKENNVSLKSQISGFEVKMQLKTCLKYKNWKKHFQKIQLKLSKLRTNLTHRKKNQKEKLK
ncbi:minor head protein [Lactococcus phage 340]|uniref:Uncharacterized protein n=1 Tax=Lactococcus phage 340 TaxID=1262533 RepID=R9R0U7_9CAUD|nr:minor head protein [Lactococcus phage 340]AGI10638.1 hypothetical protein 340_006 [Lactococcus phage 340]